MPIRKCKQLNGALDRYYGKGEYFRDDLALRGAIAAQAQPPTIGMFLAEVCVVADWGSIPQFPFDDRVALASEIEASWPLLQRLRTIHESDWAVETDLLASAVDALSNTRLLQPSRRQLSFLSKYLHFCINDGFPIWDSNARSALAHADSATTWPSYKSWLKKVRQEANDHSACCLAQRRLPIENLVRTLDKALYMIGQRVSARQSRLAESKKKAVASAAIGATAPAQPVPTSSP